MSVLSYVTGDPFIVRIFKYWGGNIDNEWVNTYEFRATANGDDTVLRDLVANLVSFENHLHVEAVHFSRATVSTWEPDSVPYNPDNLIVVPLTGVGARPLSVNHYISTKVCLYIRRTPDTGRLGKLFLRGALFEEDVQSDLGTFALQSESTIEAAIQDAIDTSFLSAYMAPGGGGLEMCLIGNGMVTRPVTGLHAAGVVTVSRDHRYFDHA